jgi:hypothetical protein
MALALLLVSGVALARSQSAPRQMLDVYCKVDESTLGFETSSRSTALAAQTFKAKHTGRLTSAKVRVADVDNEPTAIVMEIRGVNSAGTPTEMVEARTTIPAPDVPDRRMGVATGYFRPGAPVEAGQQYAIVLHLPAGGGQLGRQQHKYLPRHAHWYHESPPRVFQTSSPNLDQFFTTFVAPRTTGATTMAGSANDGPIRDTSTKGGGYPTPVASPSSSWPPLCWCWCSEASILHRREGKLILISLPGLS